MSIEPAPVAASVTPPATAMPAFTARVPPACSDRASPAVAMVMACDTFRLWLSTRVKLPVGAIAPSVPMALAVPSSATSPAAATVSTLAPIVPPAAWLMLPLALNATVPPFSTPVPRARSPVVASTRLLVLPDVTVPMTPKPISLKAKLPVTLARPSWLTWLAPVRETAAALVISRVAAWIVPFGSPMVPAAASETVPAFTAPAVPAWPIDRLPLVTFSASAALPPAETMPSTVNDCALARLKPPLLAAGPRSAMWLAPPSATAPAVGMTSEAAPIVPLASAMVPLADSDTVPAFSAPATRLVPISRSPVVTFSTSWPGLPAATSPSTVRLWPSVRRIVPVAVTVPRLAIWLAPVSVTLPALPTVSCVAEMVPSTAVMSPLALSDTLPPFSAAAVPVWPMAMLPVLVSVRALVPPVETVPSTASEPVSSSSKPCAVAKLPSAPMVAVLVRAPSVSVSAVPPSSVTPFSAAVPIWPTAPVAFSSRSRNPVASKPVSGTVMLLALATGVALAAVVAPPTRSVPAVTPIGSMP